MLDRSPEASLLVFRSAASARALTSPRSRDRSPTSMFLNSLISVFFITIASPRMQLVEPSDRPTDDRSVQSLAMVLRALVDCQTGGGQKRLLAEAIVDYRKT